MANDRNYFVRLCCFVALVLASLLMIFDALESAEILKLGANVSNILNLIKDVALLLGVAFGAYAFAKSLKKTGWMVVYWVALLVYIAFAIIKIL